MRSASTMRARVGSGGARNLTGTEADALDERPVVDRASSTTVTVPPSGGANSDAPNDAEDAAPTDFEAISLPPATTLTVAAAWEPMASEKDHETTSGRSVSTPGIAIASAGGVLALK